MLFKIIEFNYFFIPLHALCVFILLAWNTFATLNRLHLHDIKTIYRQQVAEGDLPANVGTAQVCKKEGRAESEDAHRRGCVRQRTHMRENVCSGRRAHQGHRVGIGRRVEGRNWNTTDGQTQDGQEPEGGRKPERSTGHLTAAREAKQVAESSSTDNWNTQDVTTQKTRPVFRDTEPKCVGSR